jgi:hypothetical protein
MTKRAEKSPKSPSDQDAAGTSPATEIERHAISRKENVGKEDALNSFSFPHLPFFPLPLVTLLWICYNFIGRCGN